MLCCCCSIDLTLHSSSGGRSVSKGLTVPTSTFASPPSPWRATKMTKRPPLATPSNCTQTSNLWLSSPFPSSLGCFCKLGFFGTKPFVKQVTQRESIHTQVQFLLSRKGVADSDVWWNHTGYESSRWPCDVQQACAHLWPGSLFGIQALTYSSKFGFFCDVFPARPIVIYDVTSNLGHTFVMFWRIWAAHPFLNHTARRLCGNPQFKSLLVGFSWVVRGVWEWLLSFTLRPLKPKWTIQL